MTAVRRFIGDVVRAVTWRQLLLMQLLFAALDMIAVLSFVRPYHPSMLAVWSRVVIEETMAFSIVVAVLVARQAVARGARRFRAYALAIVVASVFAGVTQFGVRQWLGLYTNSDQPRRSTVQRRMQMVWVFSDTLTYGVLFILGYVDYEERERLLQRVRAAALDRAQQEQQLAQSRLAALRSEVDAAALLQTLQDVREAFEQDAAGGEQRLDELIEHLRAQLGPVESARAIAVTR